VRPVVPTHLPFEPVQTINQYLPNGANPLTRAILSYMELKPFDRLSTGIAYLAERRCPKGFRLWESAVLAEQ
jgi:hypothetical protein